MWDHIARDNIKAAQLLGEARQFRSCASRAYYAAFSAVSYALRSQVPFNKGRETPPHHALIGLLQTHLVMSPRKLEGMKAMIRRLYDARIEADYKAGRTVDDHSALKSRQDAYSVCLGLGAIQ